VHVVLCANPASGGGSDSPDALAATLRERGATVTPLDLSDLGDPAALGDAERLVIAGGDGSIGPAAATAAAAGVPLAVLPTGTANDFARALELPADLEAACALALDPAAQVRRLDLAAADEQPFVNAASAGLAPAAARSAKPLKRALGPLAYALGAAHAGLTAKPLHVTVAVDGATIFTGGAWQLVVGNTGAFGGGSAMGAAEPDDGLLDVAVVPSGPRVALLRRARAMRAGRLVHQDDVVHGRGARVVVTGAPSFNVDGEVRPASVFAVTRRAFGLVVA
jgi:diacylglycerol kinase family enzyme